MTFIKSFVHAFLRLSGNFWDSLATALHDDSSVPPNAQNTYKLYYGGNQSDSYIINLFGGKLECFTSPSTRRRFLGNSTIYLSVWLIYLGD